MCLAVWLLTVTVANCSDETVVARSIFARWEHRMGVSYSTLSLVKFVVGMMFAAHWVCIADCRCSCRSRSRACGAS
jgi:uncharacterized membrane protein YciS (DUF1049 family)